MGGKDESPVKKLIKLKRHYDAGLIDREQFEQMKERIFSGEEVDSVEPAASASPPNARSSRLVRYVVAGFAVGLLIMLVLGTGFAVFYTSPLQPCDGSSLIGVSVQKVAFMVKSALSFLPFVEKPEFVLVANSTRIVVSGVDEQHGLISMTVNFELKNNASTIASPAGKVRLVLENGLTKEKVFSRRDIPPIAAGETTSVSFPFVLDGSLKDVGHFRIASITVLISGEKFSVNVENGTFKRVLFTQIEAGKGGNGTGYVVGGLMLMVSSSYLTGSLTAADGSVLTPTEGMSYLVVRFSVHNVANATAHLHPMSDSFVRVGGTDYAPTEQNYKLPAEMVLKEDVEPEATANGVVVYSVPTNTGRATVVWLTGGQTLRWDVVPMQSSRGA